MLTLATFALSFMLPFLAPAGATVNAGVSADGTCQMQPGGNPPLCG